MNKKCIYAQLTYTDKYWLYSYINRISINIILSVTVNICIWH